MDREQLEAVGRALAERHAEPASLEPEGSLLNYAERSRVGDWSMRSALMRFAQPEAERAGQVLELVRRLDHVLHAVARPIERHTVVCDRALAVDALGSAPVEPYPDARVADLARVLAAAPGGLGALLAGYGTLEADELAAIPLLGVALDFDALADTLTEWANRGPADPPVGAVDQTVARVRARLDELGVPVEDRPPGPRGRGV